MEEQKPFEMKFLNQLQRREGTYNVFDTIDTSNYIADANAEIRRLQQEVERKAEAFLHMAKSNNCFMEAIAELQKQIADAPTWGEWQDVSAEVNRSGAYDVEFEDGSSELHTRSDLQYMLKRPPVENSVKRFRRLNYEPQPAHADILIERVERI